MRRLFTSIAPAVITGIVGLLVLGSYLIPALTGWRIALIDVALIVAAVALLMGFIHLLIVHWQRFRQRKSLFYSPVLILVAIVTLIVLLVDRVTKTGFTTVVFDGIIMPAQSALGALLAVFLVMAAFRLARRRSWGAIWFLITAFVVLITQIPPTGTAGPLLSKVREIFDAITTGGMRGLLLGVALGTLAVAVRVLLAIDRPQSE